jgi:MFS family permease
MGSPNNNKTQTSVGVLLFYFGLVYFMQGLGQASGLVSQPLNFFFKEALGLDPAQVTEYLSILTFPWIIKPLYGLLSDYVPLLGYRRKTWLMTMNALACLGFLWLTGLSAPAMIVWAMMLTAFGTAASDVIVDALMVEKGKALNATGRFQSVQWFWFYVASIGTSLIGGYLCSIFPPSQALQIAAVITFLAPLSVFIASWVIVKEEKAKVNLGGLKQTFVKPLARVKPLYLVLSAVLLVAAFCYVGTKAIWALPFLIALFALRTKTLWFVALFIAFWNFSPSFGTPFYYHMVDTLKFSQDFIGQLGAISAVGSVLGAIAYGRYFSKKTFRFQLMFSIVTGVIGTVSYLSLVSFSAHAAAIAITLNLVFGVCSMVAILATLTLAARACPSDSEGFTFAALMSVNNAAAQVSAIVGAKLYVGVFASNLTPLIWVSAAFTFACIFLLPLLKGVSDEANKVEETDKKDKENSGDKE